jgi:hypothetical protein
MSVRHDKRGFPINNGTMAYTYNPNTWEGEAGLEFEVWAIK